MTAPAPTTQVWRLAGFGRGIGMVVAGVPAVIAVGLWVQAAVRLSPERVLPALAVTGVALVYGLFVWWVALRPKLVITHDEVVVMNPWGTRRAAVVDVVRVSRGLLGARLHLRTGWSVTSFVLAEAYGGRSGRRVEEVRAAIVERQRGRGC